MINSEGNKRFEKLNQIFVLYLTNFRLGNLLGRATEMFELVQVDRI